MQSDALSEDLGGRIAADLAVRPPASPTDGGNDLLNQTDLAVGCGAERAQVAGFDAVSRQGTGGARHSERRVAVVPAGVRTQQAVRLQGLEGWLVQAGCFAQLDVGQSEVTAAAQVGGGGQIGVADSNRDLGTR